MLYWITLIIAGASLMAVVAIIFRHWKEIRLLNPDSIKEERERQKREELIVRRFERVTSEKLAPVRALILRAWTVGKIWYHGLYLRLLKLEKYYSQAKSPFAFVSSPAKEQVRQLLGDAESLFRDLKYADAERRYLEVLAIDKRNWEAYKGLGQIYLKQQLLPQAKETFEFILSKRKADDTVYASLAEIAEAGGDAARVEDLRRKAVEVAPRMAVRHAELAAFYLARSAPDKALPFARRATALDEASAKYLELLLETAILLGDRKEAGRSYDRLRLVSDDRAKLQTLKEKLDVLTEKIRMSS